MDSIIVTGCDEIKVSQKQAKILSSAAPKKNILNFLAFSSNANNKRITLKENKNSKNLQEVNVSSKSESLKKYNLDKDLLSNVNSAKEKSYNSNQDSDVDIDLSESNEEIEKSNEPEELIEKRSFDNLSLKIFKLEQRNTPEYLCCDEKATHKYLPFRLKDNSKYKKRLISYLRKDLTSKYKNESCKQLTYLKNSFLCKGNFQNFKDVYEKSILTRSSLVSIASLKTSISSSLKTKTITNKIFICKEGKREEKFSLYDDFTIGFDVQWQMQLKISEQDDDVETDDEQISMADRHVKKDNRETINSYKNGQLKCRNLNKYSFVSKRPVIRLKGGKILK